MIIYKITNTINNKIYIGQTTRNLSQRKSEYKRFKFYNFHLENAFKKYGFNNFQFEEIDTALTIDELNQKEINWIKYHDSTNKLMGYNILIGGRNSPRSLETKNKMSMAHIGTKQSTEWINKRVSKAGTDEAKKYGKEKTEEDRRRISENSAKFWLGKSRDDKTKQKISKSEKGQLPSNCKLVFKIDTAMHTIITTYESTSEAARLNPNYSQSKISRICNNKIKSKDNFTFSFNYHS